MDHAQVAMTSGASAVFPNHGFCYTYVQHTSLQIDSATFKQKGIEKNIFKRKHYLGGYNSKYMMNLEYDEPNIF